MLEQDSEYLGLKVDEHLKDLRSLNRWCLAWKGEQYYENINV